MNNEKVYIEGRVVGSFAGTLGSKGKKIHLINGDIVDVDDSFIIESIEPEKPVVPAVVSVWYQIYKKRFIRQRVKYDWCSKEHLEEVVDIRKNDFKEVE